MGFGANARETILYIDTIVFRLDQVGVVIPDDVFEQLLEDEGPFDVVNH